MPEGSALTPRQRQRNKTIQEILTAARRELRAGREFSVRSVAAHVGLSSQGLYRYVESIDELRALVTRQIVDSIIEYMTQASAQYARSDDKLIASVIAFRVWALANRNEFRHAFMEPVDPADDNTAPRRIEAYFTPLACELVHNVAAESDPPPGYVASATDPESNWLFQYAWARLYGIVALEAFQQVDDAVVASGLYYRAAIIELTERLQLPRRDELTKLMDTELAKAS